MDWEVPSTEDLLTNDLSKFVHFAASDFGYGGSIEDMVVNWLRPLILAAKANKTDWDNPNWNQAMNGQFSEEYWEAACTEVQTLEKIDAWEVVQRELGMNGLSSKWAFKCKRFPDGLIKKFKARFYNRGDQQVEGVEYFETYVPVIMWVTICLMLILECLLDLKFKQGDVACAFLQAHLKPKEEVYVHMLIGFKQFDSKENSKDVKLKLTLYGRRQSPRAFWKFMVENLEHSSMKQSKLYP